MFNPFFIFEPALWHNLAKETGHSEEGFALIVKNGQLGLEVFESEFLSHFDSFGDFFSNIEFVIELGQDIVL
jgi:hypothetical protein